jgi:hypothetical protein
MPGFIDRNKDGYGISHLLPRFTSSSNFSGSAHTTDNSSLLLQLHQRIMEIGADRGAAESVDQYLLYLYGGKSHSDTCTLGLICESGYLSVLSRYLCSWADEDQIIGILLEDFGAERFGMAYGEREVLQTWNYGGTKFMCEISYIMNTIAYLSGLLSCEFRQVAKVNSGSHA